MKKQSIPAYAQSFVLSVCITLGLWFAVMPASFAESKDAKVQAIRSEIKTLATKLDERETEASKLAAELRDLEQSLGTKAREQELIENDIAAANKKVQKANTEQKALQAQLEQQKTALAQQLQALYTAGEQSHLRLLLKQDEPADIGRTMQYFEYLNNSRLDKINTISGTLDRLEKIKEQARKDKLKLQKLKKRLSTQKADLKKTTLSREAVLKKVQGKIKNTKSRIARLKNDEIRLQRVVNKIVKELPKVRTRYTPDKPFSKLRGKLSWPVNGQIVASYGQKRNEKQRWRGVLLKAAEGTKVKAIAKGRVVFSGWVNGYGYLIMVEHDKNYMSLYGYNRTVYKKEGQIVKAGDTIAAVGNSGGQSQHALYFEIRKGRSPQNPAKWCK